MKITKLIRKTCKAKNCKEEVVVGSYCAVHYRKHRRYENMNIKGDT